MMESSAIEISPYVSSDQKGVLELILPIQTEEFGVAITAADQPDLTAIPEFYQTGTGGFWVARSNGKVIGSIALRDFGKHQAALRKMFVAAPFRGKEHGVAGRLLANLLNHARTAGLRRIYLGTTEKYLAAHRFYEKHGFTQVSQSELPPAFPLVAVDTRFYRIDLSS